MEYALVHAEAPGFFLIQQQDRVSPTQGQDTTERYTRGYLRTSDSPTDEYLYDFKRRYFSGP
jgi:hypothetical protein